MVMVAVTTIRRIDGQARKHGRRCRRRFRAKLGDLDLVVLAQRCLRRCTNDAGRERIGRVERTTPARKQEVVLSILLDEVLRLDCGVQVRRVR